MNTLETERLYLREITAADAENAHRLNLDPEVIRYTGDEAFASVNDARNFLENYDHYRKYGFGRWAVIRKDDGAFLGWCGLKYSEELDEYDVGYRFFREFWNMGYATEAAKACIEAGFEKFNMKRIIARAMKENLASLKVIRKLGMRYHSSRFENGAEEMIFEILK